MSFLTRFLLESLVPQRFEPMFQRISILYPEEPNFTLSWTFLLSRVATIKYLQAVPQHQGIVE